MNGGLRQQVATVLTWQTAMYSTVIGMPGLLQDPNPTGKTRNWRKSYAVRRRKNNFTKIYVRQLVLVGTLARAGTALKANFQPLKRHASYRWI